VLRLPRVSKPKIFAASAVLSLVACTAVAWTFWTQWGLAPVAAALGMHPDPFSVGAFASLIPTYFIALELWLPTVPPRPRAERAPQPPMSDEDMHWNVVRIVALLCVLATELIAQMIPTHPVVIAAAHAAIH
jgi:hypothetical protein